MNIGQAFGANRIAGPTKGFGFPTIISAFEGYRCWSAYKYWALDGPTR
jgi:hypothetical protein